MYVEREACLERRIGRPQCSLSVGLGRVEFLEGLSREAVFFEV